MDATSDGSYVRETVDGKRVVRVKKKRKRKKKKNKLKIVGIIVAAVIIVLVAAGAILIALGSMNLHREAENIETIDEAVAVNGGQIIEYNGHTYQYNENISSICFMGYDRREGSDEEGQADAIMVLALDTDTGEAKVISIPRNSYVDVSLYVDNRYVSTEQMQICLAFAYGVDNTMSSELVTEAASRTLFNIPIGFYYTINMQGIEPLTNSVGGVTVKALETIPNSDIVEGQDVTLTGSNALQYIRYRNHDHFNSPIERQERQNQYIQALFKKVVSELKGSPTKIIDIYNSMGSYSTTNIGPAEVSYLATVVATHGISNLSITSLQGEMEKDGNTQKYILDDTQVFETVLDVYYTQID